MTSTTTTRLPPLHCDARSACQALHWQPVSAAAAAEQLHTAAVAAAT